jgi:hypothetical protein
MKLRDCVSIIYTLNQLPDQSYAITAFSVRFTIKIVGHITFKTVKDRSDSDFKYRSSTQLGLSSSGEPYKDMCHICTCLHLKSAALLFLWSHSVIILSFRYNLFHVLSVLEDQIIYSCFARSTCYAFPLPPTLLVSNGACAHWAMLVLEAGSEVLVTVIQVVGTPFFGYGVEQSAAMTPAKPDGSITGLFFPCG